MESPTIDSTHQLVIMSRLAECCRYKARGHRDERDPWEFLRQKLRETEEPLSRLKGALFETTRSGLLAEMRRGTLNEERYAEYKTVFERLLSRGDFADIAIHLSASGNGPGHAEWISQSLSRVRPHHLFIEERRPPSERAPAWEKLVSELSRRLELDRLGALLVARRNAPRTKRLVLYRLSRNVAEYCSVMRIPLTPSDAFTPFMLSRVEALIAALLRFLNQHR